MSGSTPKPVRRSSPTDANSGDYFKAAFGMALHPHRALLVGVFLDATLQDIISQISVLQLDVVQLHGSEPLEWTRLIPVPVIRRFAPGETGLNTRGYHTLPLIDSGTGWVWRTCRPAATIRATFVRDPELYIGLAGGLTTCQH